MDVYFQFREVRHACLGRSLAGIDPNTKEIAMLPPYFTKVMEYETISSVLHLTFGELCDRHSHQTSLLLLLLGSIVNH